MIAGSHVAVFQYRFAQRTFPLGSGPDRILVDPVRGQVLAQVVDGLEDPLSPANGPLLVLPEGIYLNYLLRRVSPSPVLNYMPIELTLFAEDDILRALRARPPADVVWISKDVRSEYGVEFGESYARLIVEWLEAEYRPFVEYGEQDFGRRPFVVRHWIRR